MARESSKAIIDEFERAAERSPILGSVLQPHYSDRDKGDAELDFPTTVISWSEACDYLRIADGEYDTPLPVAWTEEKVLMPVRHEMGGKVWCICVPRHPETHRFAILYDCSHPEGGA